MPYKDKKNRTCGFLDVEEKEKSSKYVRRYLRLDATKGIIEWFADNPTNLLSDARPYGKIEVNYITKVGIAQKSKLKAKHCFVVNTPMRKYNFQANDDDDLKEWVETLNNASKIVVSDDEQEDAPNEHPVKNGVEPKAKQEDFSYKTEIVAGVVIQKKVVYSEDNTPMTVKNDDSRSQSLIPSSTSPAKSEKVSPQRVREGWAVKQGHVRKNWKRRYFVLTTSGFSYYKTDHDKEPIRYIPINDILAAKVDDTTLAEHKDNLFFVATTDRIYYIQADSPDDMEKWVRSFNSTVHSSRSVKHRTKGSEPGDNYMDERKGSGASMISSGEIPRRRKVESTLSLASPTQRNSTQIIVGKVRPGNVSNPTHSPVTYYRLSTTDEVLIASKQRPNKKRSSLRKSAARERNLVDSSSEESCGLDSSMDSLNAPLTEGKVTNYTFTPTREVKPKTVYKRSCSGSDIISPKDNTASSFGKDGNSASKDGEDENRHSFPSSKNVSVQVKPENLLPSSASFSSPTAKPNPRSPKPPLSSQSFSNPNLRPSRSFLFDPKVDHRAAVKPSTVKKKRNTGILFSLNNMLNKKAEKMKKSNSKK